MKIVSRDIEIMGWILEQKFMTVNQVKRVFWKDIGEKSIEAYRRLFELQRAGYLKRSKKSIYRNVLYLVTASGLRQLKVFSRDRGLCEMADLDYANYKHDVMVTELRILFHQWGYNDWLSERVLSRRNDFRRVPDGIIHHKGKYFAIEYESTQKSKDRYKEIFLEYELDEHIQEVIYVVDTPELVTKLCREAGTCDKLHFVELADLEKHHLHSQLKGASGQNSLHEILERQGATCF